jgi:hypothetical protein
MRRPSPTLGIGDDEEDSPLGTQLDELPHGQKRRGSGNSTGSNDRPTPTTPSANAGSVAFPAVVNPNNPFSKKPPHSQVIAALAEEDERSSRANSAGSTSSTSTMGDAVGGTGVATKTSPRLPEKGSANSASNSRLPPASMSRQSPNAASSSLLRAHSSGNVTSTISRSNSDSESEQNMPVVKRRGSGSNISAADSEPAPKSSSKRRGSGGNNNFSPRLDESMKNVVPYVEEVSFDSKFKNMNLNGSNSETVDVNRSKHQLVQGSSPYNAPRSLGSSPYSAPRSLQQPVPQAVSSKTTPYAGLRWWPLIPGPIS